MNVESFDLDHRTVSAPYVRLAATKTLTHGDVVKKYDVRFTQPNEAHLEMPVVHSIEHMFAESVRDHSDKVIDFSPMGCQTGFYLTLAGEWDYDEVLDLIEVTMHDVEYANHVPAANEEQCGWGSNHSLYGARLAVEEFLLKRSEWSTVHKEV